MRAASSRSSAPTVVHRPSLRRIGGRAVTRRPPSVKTDAPPFSQTQGRAAIRTLTRTIDGEGALSGC